MSIVSEPGHWGRISEVRVDSASSWAGRTFLTFDMDWAHDEAMRYTHAILLEAAVTSTWFATHDSPFLAELRADPNVELGIHPNFNKLLEGDHSNGRTVEEVIDRLLEIVPEAKSARAHSLMQSSRVLDAYAAAGLTHDATHLVDPSATESLRPWRHWNGLVRVPLSWEDDVACIQHPGSPSLHASWPKSLQGSLRQLNFHPVHVFLNTEALGRYEQTRPLHNEPSDLVMARNPGAGIRTVLGGVLAEQGP